MEKVAFNILLGKYVKQVRVAKGWTQVQLADKLDSDFQYISSLERGEFAPTVYWIYNLANAFEIDFSEFMNGFHDYIQMEV
jgi:transcriptional regulator with XRE-family HTH domain